MKIIPTVPPNELSICERVRFVRRDKWMMGQPDFAKELGISRERLASYEYGRATVRFDLADRLCVRFNINHRWLATGKPPTDNAIHLSPELRDEIDGRMLFSEAHEKFIAPFFARRLASAAYLLGVESEKLTLDQISKVSITCSDEGEMLAILALNELREYSKNTFKSIPPNLAPELLKRMKRAFKEFERENSGAIRDYRKKLPS